MTTNEYDEDEFALFKRSKKNEKKLKNKVKLFLKFLNKECDPFSDFKTYTKIFCYLR